MLTEPVVMVLAVGDRLFSSCDIVLSVMVWWLANGFGEMEIGGSRAVSNARTVGVP